MFDSKWPGRLESLACPEPTAPASSHDLVDGLLDLRVWPTMIVTEEARLVAANGAARAMLQQRTDWLIGPAGELRCSWASSTSEFHDRVKAVAAATAPVDMRYAECVTTTAGGRAVLMIARIGGGGHQATDEACETGPAHILVTWSDGTWRPNQSVCDMLVSAYRFTPTEARLSLALLEGHTVKGFAAATGVKTSTVRWHLRNILSKAECAGQRDLIKLLMSVITL
ncbi:MAG: hypothetical protein KDJ37_00290 [Hyphomicrobiaceae bacterium]|nr:hypothetical protein [Hyphomicrobiaceae bacterium]